MTGIRSPTSATIAALRYLLDNLASGLTVVVTSRRQRGLLD